MKIVGLDNFNRESVADLLVAENIRNEDFAKDMCEAMQAKHGGHESQFFFVVKPDDYVLWRGMEELV